MADPPPNGYRTVVCRSCGRRRHRTHCTGTPVCRDCLTPPRTGWQTHAACADPSVDPTMFDPEVRDPATVRAALAVCADCPVIGECDADAAWHRVTGGVWGGRLRGDFGAGRRLDGFTVDAYRQDTG